MEFKSAAQGRANAAEAMDGREPPPPGTIQ